MTHAKRLELLQSGWNKLHAERFAKRHAINGQPNGYMPITEAELQEMHRLDRERDNAIAEAMGQHDGYDFNRHLRLTGGFNPRHPNGNWD